MLKGERNMNQVYELMNKYGKMLTSQGYSVGNYAMLVVETKDGVFSTRDGADLNNLKLEDIEKLNIKSLPVPSSKMKAMVYTQTPYCQQCLREAKPFPAMLDDMAQIVGPKAYVVDGRDSNKFMGRSLLKALKHNAGCFILKGFGKNGKGMGYTMTMGRNLYEAVLATIVLEKSAEVFIRAEKIGGCNPIPIREAKRMRKSYLKKYSKAEERVRSAEVE
jgi:hypothetical protein